MKERRAPMGAEPVDVDVAAQRPCTRCDGQQHLVAGSRGMGKYRCDTCAMVVGFDLEGSVPEFLVDRGLPSRYTRDVFGTQLLPGEMRLSRSSVDA